MNSSEHNYSIIGRFFGAFLRSIIGNFESIMGSGLNSAALHIMSKIIIA